MTYVATFFSHYDALVFCQELQSRHIPAKMLPVPRKVSTSCGTGVQFETNEDIACLPAREVDRIFEQHKQEYCLVYQS